MLVYEKTQVVNQLVFSMNKCGFISGKCQHFNAKIKKYFQIERHHDDSLNKGAESNKIFIF